jgi:hypothetical protein
LVINSGNSALPVIPNINTVIRQQFAYPKVFIVDEIGEKNLVSLDPRVPLLYDLKEFLILTAFIRLSRDSYPSLVSVPVVSLFVEVIL